MNISIEGNPKLILGGFGTKEEPVLNIYQNTLLSNGEIFEYENMKNWTLSSKIRIYQGAFVNDLLIINDSKSRVVAYTIKDQQIIGNPVVLAEDLGLIEDLSLSKNNKWLALASVDEIWILMIKYNETGKFITGVTHFGTIEDSVTHLVIMETANADEYLLITLNSSNTLKTWLFISDIQNSKYEISNELGRYPITCLIAQEPNLMAISNCHGFIHFHEILSDSCASRSMGIINLSSEVWNVNSDIGCEILQMDFIRHNFPGLACVLVASTIGIVTINVRSREIMTNISFENLFSSKNIFNSLVTKMSWSQKNNQVWITTLTTEESKIWIFKAILKFDESIQNQYNEIDLEDGLLINDAGLKDQNCSNSVIANDPINKDSFLNFQNPKWKLPTRQSSPLSNMFGKSKSVPNLKNIKVKSSGYGTISENAKRKLFVPIINQTNNTSKDNQKKNSASLVNVFTEKQEDKGHCKKYGERAKWLKKPLDFKSKTRNATDDELPKKFISLKKIWNAETVKARLKFSSKGKMLASYGSENSSQIINSNILTNPGIHLVGHTAPVNSVDFSHTYPNLVITASEDKSVRLWDWKARISKFNIASNCPNNAGKFLFKKNPKNVKPAFGGYEVNKSIFYYIDQFILSSAGNALYVHKIGGLDDDDNDNLPPWYSPVKTWTIPNIKSIPEFSAANQFYSYLVVCGCSDKTIRILDMNHQKIKDQRVNAHTRPINSLVQANGGPNSIVNGGSNYNLIGTSTLGDGAKLWDMRAIQKPVQRYDWPGSDRNGRISGGLDFSPCINYIAIGGEEGGVFLYDLRKIGSYMIRLSGGTTMTSPITDVAFNPGKTCQLLAANLNGQLLNFSI